VDVRINIFLDALLFEDGLVEIDSVRLTHLVDLVFNHDIAILIQLGLGALLRSQIDLRICWRSCAVCSDLGRLNLLFLSLLSIFLDLL